MGTSYVTLNTYDAVLRIPSFQGLYQDGGGITTDPRYAYDCENALMSGGTLRPYAANTQLLQSLPHPIETLAVLYRRWHTADTEKTVLIAASYGNLYWSLPGGSSWNLIAVPVDLDTANYQSNVWSWVSYEINVSEDAPTDVLLLSNGKDGMICINGDTLKASVIQTPKKFGVIERHAERIWGGAIESDPDMLVYSAPYDPFNWEQNDDIPEEGAGDIQQPTWDGDSFTALRTFGSYLIAFKSDSVWRISGTSPDTYTFTRQYGGGTNFPRTIATGVSKIYMYTPSGVDTYNGETVSDFGHGYARDIFDRVNEDWKQKSCGCVWHDKYYLALPLDDSHVNSAVLIYDGEEGTWTLRTGVSVESFVPTRDILYFTSSGNPGYVNTWNEDSWETGSAAPFKWTGVWNDLNYKHITKSAFVLYLTVEAQSSVVLTVGIETEKKKKTKTITVAAAEKAKQRKIQFSANGRRMRLCIESSGTTPWRITGGALINCEIDYD